MKIALVTNAPPDSGMGKPARLFADALRRHEPAHDVDEFVLDVQRHAVLKNDSPVARRRPLTHVKPVTWVRLARALRLDGYDLVHLTNQTLSFLVPRCPAPAVVTVWDLIELTDPQEPLGGLAARFLYRGIPAAAHVIAVSRATADGVARAYPAAASRLTVVHPAPSPTFTAISRIWDTAGGRSFLARCRVDPVRPRILYVGSEHPRKNLQRLLEAIAAVRSVVPNVEFVKIGGAGSPRGRAEFVATADRLNLWPHITRIETATDEELLYWYHAATVLAFPSLLEGFGFPPLEAMTCGTPVVTSNRSSVPEVVGDAALLVNPESVREIADALLRVLRDAALRADLQRRGFARTARFTWESTVSATLKVYERVLGG